MENIIDDLLAAVEKEAHREKFELPQGWRRAPYFWDWEKFVMKQGVEKTAETIVEFLQIEKMLGVDVSAALLRGLVYDTPARKPIKINV